MSSSDGARRALAARRTALRTLVAGGAAALLGGCGFELRRTPALGFTRIALEGFPPRSEMAAELSTAMAPQVRVLPGPEGAELVLQALQDVRERVAVATTSAAQVRELQLRLRFRFRVRTPAGRELIPETPIELARDLSYNESAALAKEQEAADLFREMQSDAVQQVLRRLATLRL